MREERQKKIIDELSFNLYPVYLLHSQALKNVEVVTEQRSEQRITKGALRYAGKIKILRETGYYQEA